MYVCWREFEEVAGGMVGDLEEEGSWGGSLVPRIIGVGDVADLRDSEERLGAGIRVEEADCCCCCCRDDGRGIILAGTGTGVKLRASLVPGVGVHGSGIGVGLLSTSGI